MERYRHHVRKVFDVAVSHDMRITVPAVVVAEYSGVPQFAALRLERA